MLGLLTVRPRFNKYIVLGVALVCMIACRPKANEPQEFIGMAPYGESGYARWVTISGRMAFFVTSELPQSQISILYDVDVAPSNWTITCKIAYNGKELKKIITSQPTVVYIDKEGNVNETQKNQSGKVETANKPN